MSLTSTTVARYSIQKRFVLISLLIGIFVYCIGDHFYHVKTNTLVYYWAPLVDGQSVWVWPMFIVGAAVMLGVAYLFSAKRMVAVCCLFTLWPTVIRSWALDEKWSFAVIR